MPCSARTKPRDGVCVRGGFELEGAADAVDIEADEEDEDEDSGTEDDPDVEASFGGRYPR